MKPIQARTKVSAAAERDEIARLADIETFERRHLDAWIDSMTWTTSLSPSDVLAAVSFFGSHGCITELYVHPDGSCRYRKATTFVGWTLAEIAPELFRVANLKDGDPIPDRDVIINPKRTATVAQMLAETHRFMKLARIS